MVKTLTSPECLERRLQILAATLFALVGSAGWFSWLVQLVGSTVWLRWSALGEGQGNFEVVANLDARR